MANLQLADNLKKYREINGYTQEYVSMRLNISRQVYSNYERGKRNPDIDLLVRLANLYGITLNQLILVPFSKRTSMIKETNSYTTSCLINEEDTLFISRDEALILLKYREAKKEHQFVINTILNAE
ncbi:MAG: helix-turn-helix transcriptional regulator [Schaedlerella sp.]|nr:helix-turn-helix transcriptional regulator [Schaedlerella sp.]